MVAPSLERLPPCGYSIMAITAAFQAEDRGSTPRTRSNYGITCDKSLIDELSLLALGGSPMTSAELLELLLSTF